MPRQDKKTSYLATAALLLALALIASYIDSLFSSLMPLPGVKLGLANIVVMFAFYNLSKPTAAVISLLRVVIVAMLFGNVASLLFSLCGAICSFTALLALFPFEKKGKLSKIGISIASAALHGAGQIIAAAALYGSYGIIYYLSYLLFASVPLGILTGALLIAVEKRIKSNVIQGRI